MNKQFTICTTNIQNKYKKKTTINNCVNSLINKKIDIICTQETPYKYIKQLTKNINNYKIYGQGRWKILGIFLRKSNETNSIITHYKVLKTKTITLPWLPHNIKELKEAIKKKTLIKRIMTYTIINIPNIGNITICNTHLDYGVKTIQKRQMNHILKILTKEKNQIILTGDFNATPNNNNMKYFQQELNKLNINSINNQLRTYDNKQLDYIFISNTFNITNTTIINNKDSDHEIIKTTLKI